MPSQTGSSLAPDGAPSGPSLIATRPTLAEHLDASRRPKRILALDGGGVRGVMSLQFLRRIESVLRERHGDPQLRLCDYFDLIGGASTGAILAAGLATGRTVGEIEALYREMAPKLFGARRAWGLWRPRFDASALTEALDRELGGVTLGSPQILTGLAIVAKRSDTGSVWVLTNNPASGFWDGSVETRDGVESHVIGNRDYSLAKIVRASAAAPFFFEPEVLEIAKSQAPGQASVIGEFIDGGVTGHNNPSLLCLMVAGLRGHGLHWSFGEDNLMLVSVGTGFWRPSIPKGGAASIRAAQVLFGLIAEASRTQLTLLQWMSNPRRPFMIDRAIGDLSADLLPGGPLFTYARYDIELEIEAMAELLDRPPSLQELKLARDFLNPAAMRLLEDLGARAASLQVAADDFPPRFDLTADR